jgi:hypothetical protein
MLNYILPVVALLTCALVATVMAQAPAPNPRDIQLVGDRFKPLQWDQMTPEQKKMMGESCEWTTARSRWPIQRPPA